MRWEPLLEQVRRSPRPSLVTWPEPWPAPASVALLAGSFDPVTIAHVAMARAAGERAELVVLVYSVRTLPKQGRPGAPLLGEVERLIWLERVRESRDGVAIGLASHGLLADQVLAAHELFPTSDLFVVVGSDKLLQLLDPAWYEDREAALRPMFERARVLYTVRSGDEESVAAALEGVDAAWRSRIDRLGVPAEIAAVSSRDVRDRLRRGEDVTALVPAEVRPLLAQRVPGSR